MTAGGPGPGPAGHEPVPDSGPADPDPAGPGPGAEEGVSDFGISTGLPDAHPHLHDPRFELAAAIRRVMSAMVGAVLSDSDMNEAAAAVVTVADRLEQRAGPGRRRRFQPDPSGNPQEFFPTSPVIGFANPIAPPVVVESVEGGLDGVAWFDYQYEGPPTCVHGGVIALVFDEILGAANIAAGFPAMTGTLKIVYRKPTPLRTPLRVEARCEGRSGRKVISRGAIYHDDLLTAEAEGIFVQLLPERFAQMLPSAQLVEEVRSSAARLGPP
ncbi:MAG TPA: PaaI family thioesterase [Acidimicrobiales bacterium]|nr:PaaI family thioesterase [Acidimicrobiales bacterium]